MYELIGERGEEAAGVRPERATAPAPQAAPVEAKPAPAPVIQPRPAEPERGGLMLKPGSAVRVPVGYLYVTAAIAVVLVFGSFMLGYQAAQNAAERERRLALTDGSAGEAALLDPLAVGNGSGTTPVDPGLSSRPQGGGTVTPADTPDIISTPARPRPGGDTGSGLPNAYFVGDGVADPRADGLNYWVVATQAEDEAKKIARFLAARNVAVVVARSGRDYEVTTLQGFARNPANDPEGRSLQERIRDLGRLYRSSEGGATDFADMWARKL